MFKLVILGEVRATGTENVAGDAPSQAALAVSRWLECIRITFPVGSSLDGRLLCTPYIWGPRALSYATLRLCPRATKGQAFTINR